MSGLFMTLLAGILIGASCGNVSDFGKMLEQYRLEQEAEETPVIVDEKLPEEIMAEKAAAAERD